MSVAEMVLGTAAGILGKVFGTANDRVLKQIWPTVEAVNALGAKYQGMDDATLREQTAVLRRRLLNGESEEDVLPDAFAVCREASHRTLGGKKIVPARYESLAWENGKFVYKQATEDIRLFAHFDVQIIGGVVLHQGKIAEMVTGEGKTLVSTLPCYLNSLRVTDEWREKALELQGNDFEKWAFKPYGRFSVEGEGEDEDEWRLMDELVPDPEDLASQPPKEIIPLSRGVHLVTVNDFLAKRDAQDNGPLYDFLSITVGAIQSAMDSEERRPIYMCDIVYGTNNEYGFDYLRDNLKVDREQQVQRSRFFAIVDEVDSVLIDEARTPLIISGSTGSETENYYLADKIPRRLKGGEMNEVEERIAHLMGKEGHQREAARMIAEEDYEYVYSERDHSAKLTERGMYKALQVLGMDDIYSGDNLAIPHFIDNALKAHALYKKDHHYMIDNGQIKIVDEHTGYAMEGRRWSDGLHQAIEAKEGLKIQEESQTVATITFQNFFRLYERLAGMTGTAMTEAKEFDKIYKLGAVSIPTNRPLRRVNFPDLIYGTEQEKFRALAEHVYEIHRTGRPILIGTVSIQRSELISEILKQRGIPHHVLNAKQHQKEAGLVDCAGHLGQVTVATNMAGRGTDIKLAEYSLQELLEHWQKWGIAPKKNISAEMPRAQLEEILRQHWVKVYLRDLNDGYGTKQPEEWDRLLQERWAELGISGPVLAERVADIGGLHIVGTERHEARRIDNQLRGRSGRQGDPGSSRFFLSLEDDTMRMFAPEKAKKFMQWAGLKDGMPIESSMVSGTVERAQRKVEERNFEVRKNLLEYDQVMNEQRLIVYRKRQAWLEERELCESMQQSCENYLYRRVNAAINRRVEEWDCAALCATMKDQFEVEIPVSEIENFKGKPEPVDNITDFLFARLRAAYAEKEERVGADTMRTIEKLLLLETLDRKWMDHLYEMDLLKEGIHLVGYAGKDSKIEYKKKGYENFGLLWETFDEEVTELVMKVQPAEEMDLEESVQVNEAVHQDFASYAAEQDAIGADAGEEARVVTIRNHRPRVGRNDPCSCGSGKKHKKCCGR